MPATAGNLPPMHFMFLQGKLFLISISLKCVFVLKHTITDHTPGELAILCSEGSEVWLLSSHISWVYDILNSTHQTTVNLMWNFSTPKELKRLKDKMGENVERVNFVVNVVKNVDGSVFISSDKKIWEPLGTCFC